jgi:CubicO group peptidase (beta-lactamase class C family)
MTSSLSTRLDRVIAALPSAYPGPGGAVAVLREGEALVRHAWGWANAEQRIPFTPRTLFRMCSPGTRYSYTNQNFRILSDVLEARLDRSFADLLRTQIFDPVGMETAFVAAETTAMPDGTEGYEGSQTSGFRPAVAGKLSPGFTLGFWFIGPIACLASTFFAIIGSS